MLLVLLLCSKMCGELGDMGVKLQLCEVAAAVEVVGLRRVTTAVNGGILGICVRASRGNHCRCGDPA